MKKMIIVLTVLLLAAPAGAAVVITAVDADGTGAGRVVTVSYNASGETELVRAFALDITADSGAKITAVENVNANYDIFPGSIDINETTGVVTSPGQAACSGSFEGTLPGLNTTGGVTVEMGSLYEAGVESPPAVSGTLCTFTVDIDCNISIVANAIRGGIVLENGVTATGDYTAATNVAIGGAAPECLSSSHPDYANWVKAGKPDCWCDTPEGSGYQCKGDADGLFTGKDKVGSRIWVTGTDLDVLIAGWQKLDSAVDGSIGTTGLGISYACADFNHSFVGKDKNGSRINVTGLDLDILIAGWQKVDNVSPMNADCFP